MKRVYSSDNYLLVGHLRKVLEDNHIRCVIKNEHLIGGAGELPPIDCWPELWVAEDFQLGKARELVDALLCMTEDPVGWNCPGCGEEIEGQFSQCWNCGNDRPIT